MAPTLSIRPSDRGDIPAVDALLARAYPKLLKADYPPSVLVTAVPLIARARPELIASGTYYVAEDDHGAIVGAGGWSVLRGRTGRTLAEVRHFVTDPDRVRQGIGRGIMEQVIASCRAAGARELACQSTLTAVPFYRALGFVGIGRIDVPLAECVFFPAVRMLLRLG
ncbi:MAG: GNAT family N-acetyltransferase [Pseudomonadota bacterium]